MALQRRFTLFTAAAVAVAVADRLDMLLLLVPELLAELQGP